MPVKELQFLMPQEMGAEALKSTLNQRHRLEAEPEQIIIRGPAQDLQKWVAAATAGYHPWRHVYPIAYEGVTEFPPYVPQLVSADSHRKVSAYICQGTQCSLPLDDLDAFRDALSR